MQEQKNTVTFGEYIKARRLELGKSLNGAAREIGMTPIYLRDIENDNRAAPENFIIKICEVLELPSEDREFFFELAGESRKGDYADIKPYIGEKHIARVALRKARDLNIPDSKWQEFIDSLNGKKKE